MGIKDILVYIDRMTDYNVPLQAAIKMAEFHDAQVIGLNDVTSFEIPSYLESDIPKDLKERHAAELNEHVAKVASDFENQTKTAGVSSKWRSLQGEAENLLSEHGRYVDLIVMGQYYEEELIGKPRDETPDHVVLSSGRPVLVIPQHYKGSEIGKRVMVCWDGGQAATRALHDAMPILHKADHIFVVIVRNSKNNEGAVPLPETDITHYLARHDIKAEVYESTSTELSIGDQLFARAADQDADLLIAGAYGHSRWKELILGGVTRQLLESMPAPVLMSH